MTAPLRRHSRLALLALAALTLATGFALPIGAAPGKPRLVVVLVVDGMPQGQAVDYRDQLAPDGLERFLDRGTWFANAHHGHGHTVTAPGHAVLLTGAHPDRTGIIGNEWYDPVSRETVSAAGTSPKNLQAETLGEVLRRLDARSKVVAVSAKDRAAILLAGKSGTAYIYQERTGLFASTAYYMKDPPRWVKDFNASKPAERYFNAEWKPLLDDSAYAKSLADSQSWYAKGGKLPKRIGAGLKGPGPAFYEELIGSPFGDELTLDFARAAIAGEGLGKDDIPDLLAVSLSGHDHVNHEYGAESRISHDHMLQLDRLVQAFLRDLDATVGKDEYVAVFTSDHGFTPAPEASRALGRSAGRFASRPAVARLDAALSKRFGDGKWVAGYPATSLYLDRALIRRRNLDLETVMEEARKALLAEPAVAAVFTRADFESGRRKDEPFFDAMRKSWHPRISGDIEVVLKPYWVFSAENGKGATHGSPHPYDTHVPMLFYGPRWVSRARVDTPVEVADLAPTLAHLLGVPAPSSSVGKAHALRASTP